MELFALFMACGLGTTFLLPETKRKSLEELCGEEAPRLSSRSRSFLAGSAGSGNMSTFGA